MSVNFPRTLSVHSSFIRACNSTSYYYRDNNVFPSIRSLMNDFKINESSMHPICHVVIKISLLYFCRVSEVISLTTRHIVEPDRVLCAGAKRSRNYIIYLPGLSKQVSNIENQGAPVLLFPVSYIKCYRSCVRAGLRVDLPGAANKKVTHAGRYVVKELAAAGFTDRQLSDVLHHRSSSSLSYYLT